MKIVHKIVHKCVHFGMLFVARGQLSRTEWFVFPTDHHGLTRIFDYAFGFVPLWDPKGSAPQPTLSYRVGVFKKNISFAYNLL